MCDASDFAVSAVLGQRMDDKPFVIYYAMKTLDSTQMNYSIIEKELFVVVFTLNKFHSYLLGSKSVVFIDYVAVRYLMTKQDVKPRLICWVCYSKNLVSPSKIKREPKMSLLVIYQDSHLNYVYTQHLLMIIFQMNFDFLLLQCMVC